MIRWPGKVPAGKVENGGRLITSNSCGSKEITKPSATDVERPALLKISQQRAAGGCSSEVFERMPAQNGAR